ncbi:peptidase [Streptomyces venezuelae]|uniref:Cys-Gln thioester bond-forming surface protein n=1 Tax=Streptomyces venezuelae TaxID=54571 RepID=UPI00123DE1BC|nr:Cys-Gln thioester bond-forming surface protein [Streptomyces venezuelae]QES15093.1 peptidase [Streptomyces venezuelae]
MYSVRGRGAARLAAATLVSGLVAASAIAVAGPASAEEAPGGNGGATATLGQLKIAAKVNITEKVPGQEKPWVYQEDGGLFEMKVEDGGRLQTYCIDFRTGAREGKKYKEVGWGESSLHNNPDAGKILWILENSFPNVSVSALAEKAHVKGLSKETAAAATQAAIWRYSDKVDATPVNKQAAKVTEYLFNSATKVEEPKASLSLSPAAVSGKAGDRLGPIKVGTNPGAKAALSVVPGAPAGIGVVDKDGKAVTKAGDGDEIFVDVPAGTADGTAQVKAEVSTKVPLGRAFVSIKGKSQTMILAGSSDSTVTALSTATWAKKGAVPAVTVAKDCAKGGLEVIASNKGDEPWTFDLKGTSHTVAPGETKTIPVPLAEDETYKFTITGPNRFEETFEGVLDCKTATPGPKPSETPTTEPSTEPSPSTPGATTGDTTGGTTGSTTGGSTTTGGGDLAETGSSNATPMIAGIAAALVVIGGGAVFFLRKKKTAGH